MTGGIPVQDVSEVVGRVSDPEGKKQTPGQRPGLQRCEKERL